MVMKSGADQPDAPKGKFLKSVSYREPEFYRVDTQELEEELTDNTPPRPRGSNQPSIDEATMPSACLGAFPFRLIQSYISTSRFTELPGNLKMSCSISSCVTSSSGSPLRLKRSPPFTNSSYAH